ncbi:MAG TPA: class I SAM-dependent methyltransferase [Rubrobacteraceae bacterium]|jgi:SAM-dependent methyltransferase|nr:class I SAM-dependent methyltransferase [Rubrobacteraceae bacterium]
MTDHTKRFTGRVESYARYRPSYPREILDLLTERCGLASDSVVADVGSGTGILSRLFLENGNRVLGVEPNAEMRAAAEELLGDRPGFTSVAGTAEDTTLDTGSVDFVVVGQAFHWFDAGRARAEFARILRPAGWGVLIWNLRRKDATPFLAAYERLLQAYRTDRGEIEIWRQDAAMADSLFGPGSFERATFDNKQVLDLDGLEGRLLSVSYVPALGEPGSEAMLREAQRIFEEHGRGGAVTVEYDTEVYYGHLTPKE